jgi:Icc-related predicted phosphoesterase
VKILHLSDTHGCHRRLRDLPEADVVVHSGDFTMNGSEAEAIDFMNWLCDLPYRHKIFICGNHDDCLYGANVDGLDDNVYYLCNSGIEIDGVKFYGVPMFMGDCVTDRQSRNYANIPSDTDVLITHSPAYGILDFDDDINYGSEEILERLSSLPNLKAHLFGHIHAQHGIVTQNGITFSNGAIMNYDYSNLSKTRIIEL